LREPSIQVVPLKYSRLAISIKEAPFSPPNTTKLPKEKNMKYHFVNVNKACDSVI
jgi:hypothetical protein